jgi:hypothetical protein
MAIGVGQRQEIDKTITSPLAAAAGGFSKSGVTGRSPGIVAPHAKAR